MKKHGHRFGAGVKVACGGLLAALLWSGCGGLSGSNTVAGVVTDGEDDSPIAGASVGIEGTGPSTTTDASGAFSLEGVAEGPQLLRTAATGFWALIDELEVPDGGVAGHEISVVSDTEVAAVASALSRTVDTSKGLVLIQLENHAGGEGATLGAANDGAFTFDAAEEAVNQATTVAGGTGELVFTGVAPGATTVTLTGGDCALDSERTHWPVEAHGVTVIRATCGSPAGVGVAGSVLASDTDAPIQGANVTLEQTAHSTATDLSGAFAFSDVAPDTYLIRAEAGGHWGRLEELEVTAAGVSGHELFVVPDAAVAEVATALGRTLDTGTGLVVIEFANHAGGEGATLGAANGGAFTFDAMDEPLDQSTTVAGGSGELIFTGVTPGTTTVTLTGGSCALDSVRGSWPVEGHVLTRIRATCG